MTTPIAPKRNAASPGNRHGKRAAAAFWTTIGALIMLTAALVVAQSWQLRRNPVVHELSQTALETLLRDSAGQARDTAMAQVDTVLQPVYAPVFAAIPVYADFHYSVLGEYTELTQAALGRMDSALRDHLFVGFEDRMALAATRLDAGFSERFNTALGASLAGVAPTSGPPLGSASQIAIADAMNRVRISAPVATLAAGAAGSGALKVVSLGIAKKLGAKIAAKTALKLGAKGGGAMAGAGTGAALCAWSGPGAALCGIAGGVIAWIAADATIIKLDEVLHRDAFEAELRALVIADRDSRAVALRAAIAAKATALAQAPLTGDQGDPQTGDIPGGSTTLRQVGRAPPSKAGTPASPAPP